VFAARRVTRKIGEFSELNDPVFRLTQRQQRTPGGGRSRREFFHKLSAQTPYARADRPISGNPQPRRVSLAAGSAPMVRRRGINPGGLSLRSEAALPAGSAPWFGGAAHKLAGCRCAPKPPYPQAAHHGSAARHTSWRVVAALRSRPTRRQCTMVRRRGTNPGGLSLRSEAALPEGSAPWFIGAA
jgi:hypothetical protein